MKIKEKDLSYQEVLQISKAAHINPPAQSVILRKLLQVVSKMDLKKVNFACTKIKMDQLPKDQPCLYLMNHSSFIDLEIAAYLLGNASYHIICTSDGLVGKEKIMRKVGCIPTKKFITDLNLLYDMRYAFNTLHSSVLMYPEASYSFDGTTTPLPESLGKCLKMFKVPVVMIRTHGAFLRDPLYNMLQIRKVSVTAEEKYLLSPQEIEEKSTEELNEILKNEFKIDYFQEQIDEHIKVDEPFRADGLNRVLYKCPCCQTEGKTEGKGTILTCKACNSSWELDEYGVLHRKNGKEHVHPKTVSQWYQWERECVREEIQNKTYHMELPVKISMLVDTKAVYRVGSGILTHDLDGFTLNGCDGALSYRHKVTSSYSLYSDFYWYEIGDVICIGTAKELYYCFPQCEGDVVAKARLAAEELFKIKKQGLTKNAQ